MARFSEYGWLRKAYRAICALSTAGKQAVPCLERRLRPAARPDAKQLRQLIVDLDSDRFATRDLASRELAKLGEVAETAVRKAQAGETSFEVRRRLKQLLEQLDGPIIWPERLQELRAIEVLEHIGTAEARQVLQTLANGAPEARITQEAKASLERLAKRP